jgi:hypothetical protein
LGSFSPLFSKLAKLTFASSSCGLGKAERALKLTEDSAFKLAPSFANEDGLQESLNLISLK